MMHGWKNKETYKLGCMLVNDDNVKKLFIERMGNVSDIMLEKMIKKIYNKKIKYDKIDWNDLIYHLNFLFLNSN